MNEKFPDKDVREYGFWKELTEIPSVEAIYISGSRARGEETPNSDLDIAVLCPEASTEDWKKFMSIINNAKLLLKIEVTRLDELTDAAFLDEINRTKSLVYYKPSKTYRHFIPDIVELITNILKDMEAQLAAPEPKNPEWLSAVITNFQRLIYALVRLMRRSLLLTGMRVEPPVLILRQAMNCGWIENRTLWENLHEDWQYSAHNCTPQVAREIIGRMPDYLPAVYKSLAHISKLLTEYDA